MLGRQTAFGGILLVGSRLATRLLDLATMLVLARILRPADFGLVAIATSLVQVVEAVLELPLNQALVRLPEISRAQCDTAFTLGAVRGLVLSFILFVAAWPLSQIYGDDRLFWLVCALTVGPVMRGLGNPSFAHFHKNMSFWRDLIVELTGKLLSFTIGIALAFLTDSYWAIAAGIIAFPTGITITSYLLKPYRPRFTLSELPVFSGFLGWMTAAQVLMALNWQSERLLLGKLKSNAELGLFSAANDMANIPMLAFLVPLQRPLLAALAKLGNDRQRVASSYQTTSSAIVAIGLPLLVGESLLAEPAIRLVLGVKWLGAVPLLRWLPLSLIPALFTAAAVPLLMSTGKTHVFFRRNLIEFCVKMPLLFAGAIAFGFP
ncbi:MAG: lipopolysaccharide biosynthesis protein, partial [Acetobacteraceae bacterium]|nr:lipopolysaccharide biosynthesis protein [Acetobacteraceae bacterium]